MGTTVLNARIKDLNDLLNIDNKKLNIQFLPHETVSALQSTSLPSHFYENDLDFDDEDPPFQPPSERPIDKNLLASLMDDIDLDPMAQQWEEERSDL